MLLQVGGHAAQGTVRALMEDSLFHTTDGHVLCISDGMGGMGGGAPASQSCVQAIQNASAALPQDTGDVTTNDLIACTWLGDAFEAAQNGVEAVQQMDPANGKAGATLVVGLTLGDNMWVGNVGDSRAFRLRGGVLKQLTEDHAIRPNVLYRFIGVRGRHIPDVDQVDMAPGDIFLFCSDGLYGFVAEDAIKTCMQSGKTAKEIADDLIALALANNTRDNSAAVVAIVSR